MWNLAPNQRSNSWAPLHWEHRVLATTSPEKPILALHHDDIQSKAYGSPKESPRALGITGLEFRRKSQDREVGAGESWGTQVVVGILGQEGLTCVICTEAKGKIEIPALETPAFEGWAKEEDQGEKMRSGARKARNCNEVGEAAVRSPEGGSHGNTV